MSAAVLYAVFVFQMYHFPSNSLHYLLSLWQRMVAPVPYVKASEPHLLETYTPEVNKAYIMSRLDYVAIVLRCVHQMNCSGAFLSQICFFICVYSM